MYSETVIEHFRAPRNAGMMRHADAVGESEDESCGDLARFYLRIEADRVTEVRFQTYGCGPSIAASSLVTELVRGWRLDALEALTADTVESALGGLPENRRHAASVAASAIRAASACYRAGRRPEVGHV